MFYPHAHPTLVRSDWHFLFDKKMFMLIPEDSDLKMLEEATITNALVGRSQTNVKKVCPLHRVTWCPRSPIDVFLIVIQMWHYL